MKNCFVPMLLLTLLLAGVLAASASSAELPVITHYTLDVTFGLKEKHATFVATVAVKNVTGAPQTRLPFLLYRLFTVEKVSTGQGAALPFVQDIVPFTDEPTLQANEVIVELPAALHPNESVDLTIVYEGYMFGYPEVMAYVKDRIDENYTLLRPDTYAYPVLAEPSFASGHAAMGALFTYDVSATVPAGYTAACGGELRDVRHADTTATFLYKSKIPTWRIDVAVAKFATLRDTTRKLFVYYLPEDSAGAAPLLNASGRAVEFYMSQFGRPPVYSGYTIIEIPDGWGSQASDFYFLQTAAAFKDSTRIGEAYHEIGHTWNATPAPGIQRCRYFDEAFASFFESYALRSFKGVEVFEKDMEGSRDLFARWAKHDQRVFTTPIADYGKNEFGGHSYTKGAWSLYVLHELAGEKNFNEIIRTMLEEFKGRTITFEEFQKHCERVTKRDLTKFFQEWIYGTESSRLMVENVPITEIVKRY